MQSRSTIYLKSWPYKFAAVRFHSSHSHQKDVYGYRKSREFKMDDCELSVHLAMFSSWLPKLNNVTALSFISLNFLTSTHVNRWVTARFQVQ
jgi:hypothetical protein